MTKAIVFGSIGTLVETSDLQRQAFNAAFAEAGLPWHWARDTYKVLLRSPGGMGRIADYAAAQEQTVDAAALHRRKTEIYAQRIAQQGLTLRPGVADVIGDARACGRMLAFATTTSRANIDAIFAALGGAVSPAAFDLITDRRDVAHGKPAPDVYHFVLSRLSLSPTEAVAIEDTGEALSAATGAGVTAIGFPNAYADRAGFQGARAVVDRVSPEMFQDMPRDGAA